MEKEDIAGARLAVFCAVLRSPSKGGLRLLEALGRLTLDYAPDQPRDENGRWTSGGGSGTIKKTKYAPSPRRNSGGISVSAKKYTQLCGILSTRYPGLEDGQIRRIRDSKREYTVKADGYGGMQILKVDKL